MTARPPAIAALALLVTIALAGCLASPTEPLDANGLPIGAAASVVNLLEDRGGFDVEVPVKVYLLGFAPGTAGALQAELTPAHIDHDFLDAVNTIQNPEALTSMSSGLFTSPALPVARYEVVDVPAEQAAALLAFAAGSEVESDLDLTLYDGRAFEDELARVLQPSADTPIFVVVHGGEALAAEHAWRYTYETGWLDQVRIFGGRLPVLVLDASAQPDPYVVREGGIVIDPFGMVFGRDAPGPDYNRPLEPSGADTVEALAQAATDAAHFRLLQGPIYPNAIRPCHTVLVYVGVRSTALAHQLGSADPGSIVDTAALTSGFTNLTRDPVTVEARVVMLPAEDPALDAATRNDLDYDLFRTWADMNWGSFFEDDGCEHYLNTLVVTDATEGIHGIALMDVQRNRRISFSWVDDFTRMTEEDGGALQDAPMLGGRTESRTASRWATFLPAHEGGHLFGQTHPHNAIYDQPVEGERESSGFTFAFSATWDSMSYQAMDRVADFGAIAETNYHRNRAGFVLGAAMAQGLQDTPAFHEAMALLGQHRWREANLALLPELRAEA